MRITEAFHILNNVPADAEPFRVVLACGFTPLHIKTFLAAHLQRRVVGRRVDVSTGLYGDLPGTVESVAGTDAHALAVVLEWADLDPRLGYRSSGSWGPRALPAILSSAHAMLDRLGLAFERVPPGMPVALSLPTLPLPTLFHTVSLQAGEAELDLRRTVLDFAAQAAGRTGSAVVSEAWLAGVSPAEDRFDFRSDLLTNLPYKLPHADALGSALAGLLLPVPPKKGLITDLDDTLWHGILGEVGPENVSWDLASHHRIHGLYQTLLSSLGEEGVLIGVSSKNDAALVQQALGRDDLLLRPDRLFPLDVSWGAKSDSVARILSAWNIAADAVVFVDDSPMELAEVAGAHPGIEAVQFPRGDDAAAYALLRRLRDAFGKARVSEEDSIRLESIRQGAAFRETGAAGGQPAETFLEQLEAVITFEFEGLADDQRVLELVNKTNQFNLNGVRYTPADWRQALAQPQSVLVGVSYQDKFGPLGKIAVIAGRVEDGCAHIETWVMSCRAFARRIEHCCLRAIFEHYGRERIYLDFAATPRNGPLQDFLASVAGERPAGPLSITREQFERRCPPLYQTIAENIRTQTYGSN